MVTRRRGHDPLPPELSSVLFPRRGHSEHRLFSPFLTLFVTVVSPLRPDTVSLRSVSGLPTGSRLHRVLLPVPASPGLSVPLLRDPSLPRTRPSHRYPWRTSYCRVPNRSLGWVLTFCCHVISSFDGWTCRLFLSFIPGITLSRTGSRFPSTKTRSTYVSEDGVRVVGL